MRPPADDMALYLRTEESADDLIAMLERYQPWGHQIRFSNGVSTGELERRVPFNEYTLGKVKAVESALPLETMCGGSVLDVGSNTGHNAIYMATAFGMIPTGIDVTQRHVDVATMLANMAGIGARFLLADAESFVEAEQFDLVLHFGTLYHLPNPLLSLRSAWQNLKPGGWLALETQVYEHPDDPNICYFMHMHNNDKSNFWALSRHVIETWLALLGFREIRLLKHVKMDFLGPDMARVIMIAGKQLTVR